MANDIYSKPIVFSLVATVVILIGTVVTMFYPMFTEGMHPKLENLATFTPLELAGRDIYQREGCNNCHTQTVRPLKTEVMRYGEYSKAGEFAYDRPFLWGSKRTGPDLARVGGKYPDQWHARHFKDPQSFFEKSNMPSYEFLEGRAVNAEQAARRMDVMNQPFTDEQIQELASKTELDALVAYMQVIGVAVKAAEEPQEITDEFVAGLEASNPLAGDAAAVAAGLEIYLAECEACHATDGEGDIGPALNDTTFLYVDEAVGDGYYHTVIKHGTESGFPVEGYEVEEIMPAYGDMFTDEEIWSLVTYIRSLQSGDAPAGGEGDN